MVRIVLKGLKETEEFGEKLGSILKPGDIISLTGDLGAGKTTLTKSIGKGLGVEDYITSPTFTLINEYKGRINLYHFDVYRLEGSMDLYDLGFEEYIYSDGISIIEWGDKIEEVLPKERINIRIEKGAELDERIIYIYGEGERFEQFIKELNID
ncbi:tRNA threonylcarbamoyladenosine biosynthesis protein TsaE [Keratinibaculum paraultunense]|uniref:tRNA threonylcarbamoyladenosine biosynthesis protein TsaE n=1 Tax=Keratinibaculum paraultunense TaxID=1278232 RepID=A0A4R3KZ48_9FIRM|nr:tRNA (adenosine(37)-N6)-threonylcarbamoyltransferase complex ATPase subunit type 1 TsaE [Keratinibaculum paraultunense]QQY80102.1 tRNA (adenosine(37)-N6)-threonylcarbamoyltransferase complex ATPase subunit type 1 TsaE [Keratinibaculum paraultunense]TCS91576.1 tRNA threonylcarbamoyladenosine biosynthesis protein TsaE [Keratinibaculum paraultunense]